MFIVLEQIVFLRITSTGHLPVEVYSAPELAVEVGLVVEVEAGLQAETGAEFV